jgi:hypothetical protein
METCSTSAKTSEPVLPFRFRRRASDFLAFRTCFGTCSVKKNCGTSIGQHAGKLLCTKCQVCHLKLKNK